MNITLAMLSAALFKTTQTKNPEIPAYTSQQNITLSNETKILLTERSLTSQCKKEVIPAEIIKSITNAVASNNEVKVNKIINEYSLDSLAKLRFDFKTEHNVTYKNINLLFLACRSGCIKIVQKLINNKNINIDDPADCCENGTSGRTALILASSSSVAIVKLLLEHNADITIKDEIGADATKFSLAFGHKNIDKCYEIQKLLHSKKQSLGLAADFSDLKARSGYNSSNITFFNDNQDFLITFVEKDNNNNVLDIAYRSSNTFIQSFLDDFKPYLKSDTSKPVSNKIMLMLEDLSSKIPDISIVLNRLDSDPEIKKGINCTVLQQQDGQPKALGEFIINFQDQLSMDSDQMDLIDLIMPAVAVFYNKKLTQINKSDLIKIVSGIVSEIIIKHFSKSKGLLSKLSNNLPNNLSDITNFSKEQQLELINELIYLTVTLSLFAILSIPNEVVSSWK